MACYASLYRITLTFILSAPQTEGSRVSATPEDTSQFAKVLQKSFEPSSHVWTTLPDDVRNVERLILTSGESTWTAARQMGRGKTVILPALKKGSDGFTDEISRSAVIRFFYMGCCETHGSGQQVQYSDVFAPGMYVKDGKRSGSLAAHQNSEGAVVFQGAAEQAVYKEKKSDLQQKLPLPPAAVGPLAQSIRQYRVNIDDWQLGQETSTGDVAEWGRHSLEGLLVAVISGELAIKVDMNSEQRFGFANPNFNGHIADALARACPGKNAKGRLAAVPVVMADPQQNAKWEDARLAAIMGKWDAVKAKRLEEQMEEAARDDRFADATAYEQLKLEEMEGKRRAIYAAKVEKATKHQEALTRDFLEADARKRERQADLIEGHQGRLERLDADFQAAKERGELAAQRGLEKLERSGFGSLVALSTEQEQQSRHQVLPDGRGTLLLNYDCVGPGVPLVVKELAFYLWPS